MKSLLHIQLYRCLEHVGHYHNSNMSMYLRLGYLIVGPILKRIGRFNRLVGYYTTTTPLCDSRYLHYNTRPLHIVGDTRKHKRLFHECYLSIISTDPPYPWKQNDTNEWYMAFRPPLGRCFYTTMIWRQFWRSSNCFNIHWEFELFLLFMERWEHDRILCMTS